MSYLGFSLDGRTAASRISSTCKLWLQLAIGKGASRQLLVTIDLELIRAGPSPGRTARKYYNLMALRGSPSTLRIRRPTIKVATNFISSGRLDSNLRRDS